MELHGLFWSGSSQLTSNGLHTALEFLQVCWRRPCMSLRFHTTARSNEGTDVSQALARALMLFCRWLFGVKPYVA
jgi:hypothetical protein